MKHHHIPQMILKRFKGKSGHIFMIDSKVSSIKVMARNPESVAYKRDLYSVHYGTKKDTSLEEKFSTIEGNASNIIDLLVDDIGKIDQKSVLAIVEFVIILMFRSPKIVEMADVSGKTDEMINILRGHAEKRNFPIEKADLYFENIRNHKGFIYSEILHPIICERHNKLVENFDVMFCVAKNTFPKFILNDNYVIFDRIGQLDIDTHGSDWWKMPIQIFCPLSSEVCLVFVPKKERRGESFFNYSTINVESNFVMAINDKSNLQKDRYIYGSCEFELQRLITSHLN